MIPRYDRDVKWPWGKYKNVPVSCIPLEYLAWFVQNGNDRIWMSLIEKELLCRKLGDKEMRSKTKFDTPAKVFDELAMNEFRQERLQAWKKDPRVGDWLKKPVVDTWCKKHSPKKKGKQQQNKTITKHTTNSTTGSYKTPTHNFDGSPVDFSKPPF